MGFIDFAVPDFATQGSGIARYCRSVALALADVCRGTDLVVRVHSLCDPPGAADPRYVPSPGQFFGYNEDRSRFSKAVIRSAWNKSHAITVFGHVNLTSLALLFPPWPSAERRFVAVLHGIEVWNRLPPHRRLGLARANALWAVTEFTLSTARAVQNVTSRNGVVVSACLDPYWDDAVSVRTGVVPAGRYILTVSRLSDADTYKGIDHLIEAFARIMHRFPDVRLVVVGKGNDRSRLETLAQSAGVGGIVQFPGEVAEEVLKCLYENCAVFAMPSLKEGFGIVYLEAMAAGKAVVAARSCGAPEVVVDWETGILVNYGKVDEIAAALSKLLSDTSLAGNLGRAGRRRLDQRFSFRALRESVSRETRRLVAGTKIAGSFREV